MVECWRIGPTAALALTLGVAGVVFVSGSSGCSREAISISRRPSLSTAPRRPAPKPAPELGTGALRTAIMLAGDYLRRAVGPDGRFVYELNLAPGHSVAPGYNILRHAGAIYAMVDLHRRRPDPKLKAAILLAGRYLKTRAIAPLDKSPGLLAVWSRPEVSLSGRPRQAKLGGAGLGLVALLGIETITPGFTPLGTLRGLGRFVLHLQNADGSFVSKLIPERGGKQANWHSLYYPGEAALGLAMLHERDPTGPWLAAANLALLHLARSRKGQTDVPADHWALIATERLLAARQAPGLLIRRQLLLDHAAQLCVAILDSQQLGPTLGTRHGGFSARGKTCPTATRLEGLFAALAFLPARHALRPRLQLAVRAGVSFLIRSQVPAGPHAGAIPRAVGVSRHASSTFKRRATEVRIDYVQHALSALLHYEAGQN